MIPGKMYCIGLVGIGGPLRSGGSLRILHSKYTGNLILQLSRTPWRDEFER
jgi:hypothetical protein